MFLFLKYKGDRNPNPNILSIRLLNEKDKTITTNNEKKHY